MELLAPGGNYLSFIASINAGADAIYLGGKSFSARMYSSNFTNEEILEAVKYHSVDDSKTPSMVRDNKIWEILKDADALDRSRLPGKGCNPSFLRNPIFLTDDGKELLSLAKELPILTIGCSWDFPVVDILAVLKEVINI